MSVHPSLKGVNTLVGQRSVLTRVERIAKLSKEGRFDSETGSPLGLPKVRTKFRVAKSKSKDKDEEETAEKAEDKE